jgi:hypothetical protein
VSPASAEAAATVTAAEATMTASRRANAAWSGGTAAWGLAWTEAAVAAAPAGRIRAAATGDIGSTATPVSRRSAGCPIGPGRTLHRRSREMTYRLDRFNAQALRAITNGIYHHAHILARLEARRVARHIS